MKIRGRDGTMREVDDGYILQDGEGFVFDMRFMDARRDMICDARGQPAGQRPGFLLSDANEPADPVAKSYAEYDEVLFNRWRQGPDQSSQPAQPAPQAAPHFASPQAALAHAYAQYDRDLFNRWRRQW